MKRNISNGKKSNSGCKTISKKHVAKERSYCNYTGEKIGKLTILEELEPHITPNGSRQRIVKCQCECGNVFTIRLSSAQKNQKCRACLDKERRIDITGKRFGKLVVLSMANDYISPSGYRLSRCRCLCDCGNITIVNMSALVTGSTQSCGCMQNTAGLLKDNPKLVAKYDFEKNKEIGIDFDAMTARASTKVWWKCSKCGNVWFATVASQNDRIEHGCPYCSGRQVIKGKTDLLTLFPDVAKEWNYDKNGDLQPSDVSSKSGIKVWWKCSEGHEWKATVGNRTNNNSGCPRCNIEKTNSFCEQAVYFYVKKAFPDAINGDQHLGIELDIFVPSIKVAIEYDGEAWHNSEKRINNDNKKNSICNEAGVRLIRIREPRLPIISNCIVTCRNDSTSSESLDDAIRKLLDLMGVSDININTDSDSGLILEQFATKKQKNSLAVCNPDISAEWHPTKNGNLTPDRVSKASRRMVWWLGKCGHEWQSIVSERTQFPRKMKNGRIRRSYGCPYCSGKRILIGFNDLQARFPDIASEWHPSKNGKLKPTDITPGSGKKVWWLGECGHEWQSTPNKRCNDNKQCPICYKEIRSPAVVCIESGEKFASGIDAAKKMGAKSASHIYKCCRNEVKTAYGYHWAYLKK